MKTSLNVMDNDKPPMLLTVIYQDKKGNTKFRQTNDSDTANKWEYKYDGEIYVDTRYKAKLRLYWYLWRKNKYQS